MFGSVPCTYHGEKPSMARAFLLTGLTYSCRLNHKKSSFNRRSNSKKAKILRFV